MTDTEPKKKKYESVEAESKPPTSIRGHSEAEMKSWGPVILTCTAKPDTASDIHRDTT